MQFKIDGVTYLSDGMHNLAVNREGVLYALVSRDLRDVFMVSYARFSGAAVRRASPVEGVSLRDRARAESAPP